MLYLKSQTYSSCITKTLPPLTNISPYLQPPAPSNHYCTLRIYEFDFFQISYVSGSCSVCPSVSGLFHLAVFSRFIHVAQKARYPSKTEQYFNMNTCVYVCVCLLMINSFSLYMSENIALSSLLTNIFGGDRILGWLRFSP